jgi:hypothetical protein
MRRHNCIGVRTGDLNPYPFLSVVHWLTSLSHGWPYGSREKLRYQEFNQSGNFTISAVVRGTTAVNDVVGLAAEEEF